MTKKLTLWKRWLRKKRIWHEHWRRFKRLILIPTLSPLESAGGTASHPGYIVSLTSYGKRLTNTAPYAIITLFNQSVKPDKIILWTGYNDKENIGKILGKLTQKGLEIRFCEDVKSYTKLIPALEAFPNHHIITADDDVFYPKYWFERLLTEHKKYPNKIICHRAHRMKVDEDHNLLPYNEWEKCVEAQPQHQSESLFPTGVAGILYPPKCFHKDVSNKELFLKLTPKNDDIWFWAMAVINKEYFGEMNPYFVIGNYFSKKLGEIDSIQHNENSLQSYNVSENGNDGQFKAVIEKYPQIKETLNRIEPTKNRISGKLEE
jgi:hypothetical protein